MRIGKDFDINERRENCARCGSMAIFNQIFILFDPDRAMSKSIISTPKAPALGHFGKVNETMARYFSEPFPARAAVGVAALPRGALVEADGVVVVSGSSH